MQIYLYNIIMFKKEYHTLLLLFLCFFSCSTGEYNSIPQSVSYTTLIYMIADNSMDSEVDYTLQSLKKGMKQTGGVPVIYLDRQAEVPRLFKLASDGTEIPLKSYNEQNSADADVLLQVINDTKSAVPNEKFGLVLWSHAMGWLPSGYSHDTKATKSTLKGFPLTRYCGLDNGKVMEITDMAKSLPDNVAEYILFDMCLMGNVETAYELRHTCHYIIASPTEVLAESSWDASGMPYEQVLPKLFGGKDELKEVCNLYYNHYKNKAGILRSATLSLTDTQELDGLFRTVSNIMGGKQSEVETMDVSSIQQYHTNNVPQVFFDLGDYIKQESSPEEYKEFKAQLDRTVLYKVATDKFVNVIIDTNKFSGLSTYIPLSKWKGNEEYSYYFGKLGWSHIY